MKKCVISALLILFLVIPAFGKLRVCTSIYILSTIVKDIGKDKVDASYIIPTSANPHIFSPKPKDLMEFSKADLFIGVGYGFEFWFNKVKYLRDGKKNLFLSNYYKHPLAELTVGNKTLANTHIWLDLDYMESIGIPKIVEALCNLDNKDCGFFKKNGGKLINQIKKIHCKYKGFFKHITGVCIVDVKPAFEYLLKSMGVNSCAVLIKRGSDIANMGDIKAAFSNCKCQKGVIIYISNQQMAQSLATRLGYKTVELNPLGNPSDEQENNYVKLIRHNLSLLKNAIESR